MTKSYCRVIYASCLSLLRMLFQTVMRPKSLGAISPQVQPEMFIYTQEKYQIVTILSKCLNQHEHGQPLQESSDFHLVMLVGLNDCPIFSVMER